VEAEAVATPAWRHHLQVMRTANAAAVGRSLSALIRVSVLSVLLGRRRGHGHARTAPLSIAQGSLQHTQTFVRCAGVSSKVAVLGTPSWARTKSVATPA